MANVILTLLALRPIEDDSVRGEATVPQRKSDSQKELLENINLTGLYDWSLDDKKEA